MRYFVDQGVQALVNDHMLGFGDCLCRAAPPCTAL